MVDTNVNGHSNRRNVSTYAVIKPSVKRTQNDEAQSQWTHRNGLNVSRHTIMKRNVSGHTEMG